MTHLQSIETLVDQLEAGIGIEGTYYEFIPSALRLRLPVCGLASYALATALRHNGSEVSLIQSRPELSFDPTFTHVFPVVHDQSGETIIDPTFSSILGFAGLTAEGVMLGDEDNYPQEKIVTFPKDAQSLLTVELTQQALRNLRSRSVSERFDPAFPHKKPALEGMSLVRIRQTFSEVWSSENWDDFRPSRELKDAAKKVAEHITSDAVRLVA